MAETAHGKTENRKMREYRITKACSIHISDIMTLYSSLIGCPGCTWNNNYPNLDDVKSDIKKESLYIIIKGNEIIAAAAADKEGDMEHISCWSSEINNPCSLSQLE